MFVAGQKDMQQMDQYTIEKLGLPGIVLMENAGAKVAEEVKAAAKGINSKIVVLAGSGNNGGDGFVIARRLFDLGYNPLLYLVTDPKRINGDAKIHYDAYLHRGLPILYFSEIEELRVEIEKADIIVDAILGTGVSGPVREPVSKVISVVNEIAIDKLVISVDIPSGVSSDTGKVEGAAIKADKTITFVFPKNGFFLQDGPSYIGEWKAVDISVPPSIITDLKLKLPKLMTEALAKEFLPYRPAHGHKGTFGHVLVLGGSRTFVGAPIFTAKAALNAGAGLVTLGVPESIYPLAATQSPELLFLPLFEEEGHFALNAIDQIKPSLNKMKTIAVGPGISRFTGGEAWMRSLFSSLNGQPVVVDADGLYLLRNSLDIVRQYKGIVIFTPHPGEMAVLLNLSVNEVEENRIEIAKNFAKVNNIYLLLKGHRAIIASPGGDIYINPLGHDALGKGGSGDVLTGIVSAFLAQGASPIQALVSASYLHAKTGEEKAKTLSHYGVNPPDLIDGVREELKKLI